MSQSHRVVWGTPKSIADDLQEWLEAGACDGFNLLFAHYPKPLEEWVTMVVPSCSGVVFSAPNTRARRSARNLGVPIPKNKFAPNRVSVQVSAAASND